MSGDRPTAPPSRRRLRRAALPAADFSEHDALLREARRLFRAVEAFRAAPSVARTPARRAALTDELTILLQGLRQAKAALGEKLNRGARANGALKAYARGAAAGRR